MQLLSIIAHVVSDRRCIIRMAMGSGHQCTQSGLSVQIISVHQRLHCSSISVHQRLHCSSISVHQQLHCSGVRMHSSADAARRPPRMPIISPNLLSCLSNRRNRTVQLFPLTSTQLVKGLPPSGWLVPTNTNTNAVTNTDGNTNTIHNTNINW